MINLYKKDLKCYRIDRKINCQRIYNTYEWKNFIEVYEFEGILNRISDSLFGVVFDKYQSKML